MITAGSANPLLLGPEGYQIGRSVRLRRSASAYFNRTFGTPTNANIWTLSGWTKRGLLGTQISLFGASVTSYTSVSFLAGDTLRINLGNGTNGSLVTTQVFRDPSAWYHIEIAYDSTQVTASNRIKLYINGVQITSFSTANYPAQNVSAEWNFSGAVGTIGTASTEYFDGYLTEVNFIDGQALTPSSFGETNPVTGVWQPKKYGGTYGTNGFYLNFSDPSAATAAAIGKDNSGNGNNWTPNNISVTAGVTYDSMIDVPTLWADGGNGRGNYAILNPLDKGGDDTVLNGNLAMYTPTSGGSAFVVRSSIAIPVTGKWYWEGSSAALNGNPANNAIFGIIAQSSALTSYLGSSSTGYGYFANNGNKYNNGTATAYGATYTSTDVIGIAFDADAGTLTFYKNNVSQGVAFSGLTGTTYFSAVGNGGSGAYINFGQQSFTYTPPTGFKALNTQNLPDSTIVKGSTAFNIALDTGANIKTSTEALFGTNYLEWIKDRANANNHQLLDTVRGTTAVLQSNTTAAETTYTAPAGSSVGWAWKKGATQGFDIVTWAGDGTAGRNIAHSLGAVPKMVFVQTRTGTNNRSKPVYHASIGNTGALVLDSTSGTTTFSGFWSNTSPTSSVFTVGSDQNVNQNGSTYVAYLFAEVAGFAKFGSYTGNGSSTDGPFVFTGMKARYILIKRTDAASTNGWYVYDTARSPSNLNGLEIYPNLSNAEFSSTNGVDMLSNGFKLRIAFADVNASGGTYIYAAFAENPFKNSLAR